MNLRLSSAPHIHSRQTTAGIMRDVIIALVPSIAAGVYLFGTRAALVLIASVITAVMSEYLWQKLAKKPVRIGDLSAVVTGLILGLNLPSNVPLWMPVIGSFFAVIIVKQLFGGIGNNFLNPASTARAVLLTSWPARMATALLPQRAIFSTTAALADATTAATPLANPSAYTQLDLFLGNVPGAIGETCKAAILIGLLYMLVRGVVRWQIPVVFVGTVALTTYLLGGDALTAILSGGVMFGAVFMATDYVTNPMLTRGQVIFAIGCGLMTTLIRQFGNYPEGVTYGILLMNCVTPLIDKYSKRRVYGEVRQHA